MDPAVLDAFPQGHWSPASTPHIIAPSQQHAQTTGICPLHSTSVHVPDPAFSFPMDERFDIGGKHWLGHTGMYALTHEV